MAIDKVDGVVVEGSTRSPQDHQVDALASTALKVQGNNILKDSNSGISCSFDKSDIEVKREMNDDDSNVVLINQRSNLDDTKDTEVSFHQTSETSQMNDLVGGFSHSSDSKARMNESEIVADCHSDKANELSGHCSLLKCDLEGSEVSETVNKISPEPNRIPRSSEESKPSINVLTPEEQCNQRKMVACIGRSSSTSSASIFAVSSVPDSSKPTDSQNNLKQQVMPDNNVSSKKSHATDDVPRDEDRHDLSHKAVKERPKSSFSSTSKVPHQSRISHASISKRNISESKDSVPSSSLKASLMQNSSVTSVSGESASSLQSQSVSHIQQNKTLASGFPQKGEKSSQSSSQPASKAAHASSVHSFATSNSTTLSDEEV